MQYKNEVEEAQAKLPSKFARLLDRGVRQAG